MYNHTNEFDHVQHCQMMSEYYLKMKECYGKSPEEYKLPEITYSCLCDKNHEYYNNGYGKRCILCGYMKIVDNCDVILPDEIVARIICTNSAYDGLLTSKSIMKESIKYAAESVSKIIPIKNEMLQFRSYSIPKIYFWSDQIFVNIISERYGDEASMNTYCICENDSFIVGRCEYHESIEIKDNNIASVQLKILSDRLDKLGVSNHVPYLRKGFLEFKSRSTDFNASLVPR